MGRSVPLRTVGDVTDALEELRDRIQGVLIGLGVPVEVDDAGDHDAQDPFGGYLSAWMYLSRSVKVPFMAYRTPPGG